MAIDRAMIERAASGGMTRPAPMEAPEDETPEAPEGAGGLIQAAAGELNKLIESGELDRRVTKITAPTTITLSAADYPELASEQPGADVVAVIGGTVQSVEGDQITLQLTETAIVHGKQGTEPGGGARFGSLGEKLRGEGATSPAGMGAWMGRKRGGKMAEAGT